MAKQTVWEFEEQVWNTDGIRVVIRSNEDEKVKKYDFTNAAQNQLTVAKFLKTHIHPYIGDRKVVLVDGYGEAIYGGGKQLRRIRETYREDGE